MDNNKKSNKVIVYSTPTCPFCVMAKEYLSEKGVQYEDVNVATDHERAREMVEKSGQMGVPVIEIDNNIVVGFQPQVFDSLLA